MLDVRGNYGNHHDDTQCPVCGDDEDTQQHLLVCEQLCERDEIVSTLPDYNDLFGSNLDDRIRVSRILMSKFEKRKNLMKEN